VIVNIVVAVVATPVFRVLGSAADIDNTVPADYRP
jgi:hypothetical protein